LLEKAKEAFIRLKNAFLEVLILAYFKRGKKTRLEVNTSSRAILGILSQNSLDTDRKNC
jgi:hypothetical protein